MTFKKPTNNITFILKMFILCLWLSLSSSHVAIAESIVNLQNSTQYSGKSAVLSPDTLQKAVLSGDINLVRRLLKDGADLNHTDEAGWTPLDFARKMNRPEIAAVLLANGAKTFPKTIPDMAEGPHVRLPDTATAEVLFLNNDKKTGKSALVQHTYKTNEFPKEINGILIDPDDLDLITDSGPSASVFTGIKKIFVVGDIHGEYERVLKLLKENRIIDNQNNWSWGKGHLVFTGDIFDRGSKVTETLWLIYSLEKQAEKSGGKVHLLLGNHEPMIFNNDLRYITDDYYSLCENLGLSYSGIFDERSLLGHWLRQKPVMIKINDFVFLHAGISPELCAVELKLDTINKIAWQYFNKVENEKNLKIRQLILGNKGVLWYRGFIADGTRKDEIDELTLNRELKFYNASRFIIGHTEVDSVSSFFSKKVIDVNIPRRNDKIVEQGLLIRGGKIWVVYDSGKRKTF